MTRVLFIPASSPNGSGEYYRCLAIARAMHHRASELAVAFTLNRQSAVERDGAFEYHLLEDTPTRRTDEVLALLARYRPHLVVFDSAGRMDQYRCARRGGAMVAWISDRPGKRRRGFRLRMMRQLDLHLIATLGEPRPRLTLLEQLKCRLRPGLATGFFSGIAPEVRDDRSAALLALLALRADAYLVFAAGGGGYRVDQRPVPEVLVEAAVAARRATGLESVVVMGPQYRGRIESHERVRIIPSLETEALTALLESSRAAVIGAGSMMTAQALASNVACVLIPAGGGDQPARIRRFAAEGLAMSAPPEPDAIAEAIGALATSAPLRARQAAAVRAAGIRNDVGAVAERLLDVAVAAQPPKPICD